MVGASRSRTEQKLRYAKIHLAELANYRNATSNDNWENAHQESCFYHLAGAVDALLHEINDGYTLELGLEEVRWKSVDQKLVESNQSSPAFAHIKKLRDDSGGWLDLLFEWRNHGAHRRRVSKVVYGSTVRRVDNEFKDPRSGEVPILFRGQGCLEVLHCLATQVRGLIDDCRSIDPKL